MKRKIKCLAILLLVLVSIFAITACNNSESEEGRESLRLNYTDIQLKVGDKFALLAEYTAKEGCVLKYKCENDQIAVVDEYGEVTAVSLGETKVIVEYGEFTEECKINVSLGEMIPTMDIIYLDADEIGVSLNDTLNLKSVISYNGKQYYDAAFTYELSDNSVGKMEDDQFVPLKIGVTQILMTGTWRGYEGSSLEKLITVNVTAPVIISLNGGMNGVEIYTLKNFDGIQYENSVKLDIKVTEGGTPINFDVKILDGEEFFDFDDQNYIVTGKSSGVGDIQVSCKGTDGTIYTQQYTIKVKRPVALKNDKIYEFDASTGMLDAEEIFNQPDTKIIDAFEGDLPLKVSDGRIMELAVDGKSVPTERYITVYNNICGYTIPLIAYSKIIYSAEDLKYFNVNNNAKDFSQAKTFDGYYVLANDIELGASLGANGTSINSVSHLIDGKPDKNAPGKTYYREYGLTGTFDGRGHTVKGMTFNVGGLFGLINGTVKDVAFVGSELYGLNATTMAFNVYDDACFENVYIEVVKQSNHIDAAGFAYRVSHQMSMNNVIVKAIGLTNANRNYGSFAISVFGGEKNAELTSWQNVYVISSIGMTYGTGNLKADASNQSVTEGVYLYTGVKRYGDEEEMKADVQNDYSSFESTHIWSIQDGIPVWKGF